MESGWSLSPGLFHFPDGSVGRESPQHQRPSLLIALSKIQCLHATACSKDGQFKRHTKMYSSHHFAFQIMEGIFQTVNDYMSLTVQYLSNFEEE